MFLGSGGLCGRLRSWVGRRRSGTWRRPSSGRCASRRPQFVTLVGAPGMGKTRFQAEWAAACERRDTFRVVTASARPLVRDGQVEPYALLAALLRSRFGMGEADAEPEDEAVTRFREELRKVFGDRRVAEVAGLLGRFLGLGLPESPLGQALASRPDQELDLSRAVLCRFLEADAALHPLVIVVDDVHLADDRTLDVLERVAVELGEAPIVFVDRHPARAVRAPSRLGPRRGQPRAPGPAAAVPAGDGRVRPHRARHRRPGAGAGGARGRRVGRQPLPAAEAAADVPAARPAGCRRPTGPGGSTTAGPPSSAWISTPRPAPTAGWGS